MERLDVLQPPSPTGNFQFTNIFTGGPQRGRHARRQYRQRFASFLVGQVTRFTIDAQSEVLGPRATIAEFFFQDDWRATRRLTLNLGVRYTLNFPSTVEDDQGAVFNLANAEARLFRKERFSAERARSGEGKLRTARRLGLPGHGFLRPPFRLLPHLDRTGRNHHALHHAAVSVHPDAGPADARQYQLRRSFSRSGPSVTPQPPNPDAGLGQGVFGVQRDNGSGYAQQWNLSLQKTFGEDWSVEAGYLGSKLTRLGVPDVNLNQLTVEQLRLGSPLTQQVPNPYYGQIPPNTSLGTPTISRAQLLRPYPRFTTVTLYRNNIGHSTYHSFQSRVEKRFSRGLTFSVAYTFSRLIDDAGAVFDSAVLTGPVANFQAADSFNKRLEKDVSTGNVPHIFSSGFVYELPFGRGRAHSLSGWKDLLAGGWQLAGIVRLQSGSPIAVTQATNLNAFAGFGIQRPNRIADPTLPSDQRTTAR